MRNKNRKKYFATLTSIMMILAGSLAFSLMDRHTADAGSPVTRSLSPVVKSAAQGVTLPRTSIYALTSDNMLYVLLPGTTVFVPVGSIPSTNGNLIGIDFRVSNNSLYGLTDTGKLLLITLPSSSRSSNSTLTTTLVSTLSPRFAGGFQSLLDFNPVVDAIRLIGSNDQNFAVTSTNGGNLNTTVVQTPVVYTTGDTNAGVNPNICGGSYTNNFPGATTTIFYAIDYDLDTFVTIANKVNGSSATGAGQLQTLGPIVDAAGNRINLNPTVDIDIFTNANGVNSLVGLNNKTIFTIDLNQINPNLKVGTTQNVVANSTTLNAVPRADSFIDIALQPPNSSASASASTR